MEKQTLGKQYRFVEKLIARNKDANNAEMPVIAFLGDSVTQGCFCANDTNAGYVSKFRYALGKLFPSVPAYVLNAGIGGNNTEWAFRRIDRDVLPFHPDLVVVNLGLNDVWAEDRTAKDYRKFLGETFDKLLAAGTEVIFMTPNAMNYYRSGATEPHNMELALKTADYMTSGLFDEVVKVGREEAQKRNIAISDTYRKWHNLYLQGVPTTEFLAGGINHPLPDAHWLFVTTLFDTLFRLNEDLDA